MATRDDDYPMPDLSDMGKAVMDMLDQRADDGELPAESAEPEALTSPEAPTPSDPRSLAEPEGDDLDVAARVETEAPGTAPSDPGGTDATAPAEALSLPEGFVSIGGSAVAEDTIRQALGLREWLAQFPLDRIQAVEAFLTTGKFPESPGSGATTAPSPVDTAAEEEWLDPRAQAEIERLRAELNSTRAAVEPMRATHEQQQRDYFNNELSMARDTLAQEFELSPTDVQVIEQHAAALQILPAIAQQFPNDRPADNIRRAFEVALNSIPDYRARVIEREVKTRLDATQAQANEVAAKRQRAGVSAATSGSVNRSSSTPQAKSLSPEQRREAAIKDMANLMGYPSE